MAGLQKGKAEGPKGAKGLKAPRKAAILLVSSFIGCAAPEQPLLERFFVASRLRDKTALQAFSTVIFEPREQGIVRSFTIASVSPEQSHGGVTTKDVTVRAPVVTPDGPIVDETLVVTLQRADERQTGFRWMVVAVKDEAASRSAAPHW